MHHKYFSSQGNQIPCKHHSSGEMSFSSTQPGAYHVNQDPAPYQRASSPPSSRDLFQALSYEEKLKPSWIRIDVNDNGVIQPKGLLHCPS